MNKLRLLTLFVLMGMCGTVACTKNDLNLPEPAQTIEGVYEAQNNQTLFPIQGKTLQLTVRRVATDSVSVIVRAISNGYYSDSLSFKSAYVSPEYGFNCVGYRVYMSSQRRIDQLNMACEEVNVFRYIYKPANEQTYSIVRFKKI